MDDLFVVIAQQNVRNFFHRITVLTERLYGKT